MTPADVEPVVGRLHPRGLGRSPAQSRLRDSARRDAPVRRRGGRRDRRDRRAERQRQRRLDRHDLGRAGVAAARRRDGADPGDDRRRRVGRLPDARSWWPPTPAGRSTRRSGSRSRPGTGSSRRPGSGDEPIDPRIRPYRGGRPARRWPSSPPPRPARTGCTCSPRSRRPRRRSASCATTGRSAASSSGRRGAAARRSRRASRTPRRSSMPAASAAARSTRIRAGLARRERGRARATARRPAGPIRGSAPRLIRGEPLRLAARGDLGAVQPRARLSTARHGPAPARTPRRMVQTGRRGPPKGSWRDAVAAGHPLDTSPSLTAGAGSHHVDRPSPAHAAA